MKRTPLVKKHPRRQVPFGKRVIHIVEPGDGGLPGSLQVFFGDYALLTKTGQVLKRVSGRWDILDSKSPKRIEVVRAAQQEGVRVTTETRPVSR